MLNHHFQQILENYTLVAYCYLYDPDNLNKPHWMDELNGQLIDFVRKNVKGGDKIKTFKERVHKITLKFDIETFIKQISSKMQTEHIQLSEDVNQLLYDMFLLFLKEDFPKIIEASTNSPLKSNLIRYFEDITEKYKKI